MKPKDYREKYGMKEDAFFQREKHADFCEELSKEMRCELEGLAKKEEQDGNIIFRMNAKTFKACTQRMRQKYDAIFMNVKGNYEKLWSFFYAKYVTEFGREFVAEFSNKNYKKKQTTQGN